MNPGIVGAGGGIAFDVDGDAVTRLGLAKTDEGGATETQLALARHGAGESDSAHRLVLEPTRHEDEQVGAYRCHRAEPRLFGDRVVADFLELVGNDERAGADRVLQTGVLHL